LELNFIYPNAHIPRNYTFASQIFQFAGEEAIKFEGAEENNHNGGR
jgi:hypothetical protein